MFYYVFFATIALVLFHTITTKLSAWQFQKAHGLAAARQIPQGERILGLGELRRMLKNIAAGVSLQSHFEATKANGPTTSVIILGKKFVSTSDPENIKTVLATKFKDFDLGERNDAFGPFLGSGIFAADGAHWEKSRVSSPQPRRNEQLNPSALPLTTMVSGSHSSQLHENPSSGIASSRRTFPKSR
jgi:hypothetical protein